VARYVVVVQVSTRGNVSTVPFYADTPARAELLFWSMNAVSNADKPVPFNEPGIADAQILNVLRPYAEG
jgi:hypothetical protein